MHTVYTHTFISITEPQDLLQCAHRYNVIAL